MFNGADTNFSFLGEQISLKAYSEEWSFKWSLITQWLLFSLNSYKQNCAEFSQKNGENNQLYLTDH